MSLPSQVDKFNANVDRVVQLVHGDKNSTVQTDNGPLPTIAKMLADSQAAIDAAVDSQITLAPRLASPAGAGLVFTEDGKTLQNAVDTLAGAVVTLNLQKANAADLAAKANASDLAAKANISDLAVKADKSALDAKADKSGGTLTRPTIKGYIEAFQALNPGATVTVDPMGLGTLIKITTTVTSTAITLPATLAGMSYTLVVKYGAASHTVIFAMAAGTLSWGTAGIPSATSVAGKRDKYFFTCDDEITMGQDGGRGF